MKKEVSILDILASALNIAVYFNYPERQRVDEPRTNEQLLWQALGERDLALFEKCLEKCVAENLPLIKVLTLRSVEQCAQSGHDIFAKPRRNIYQNIMLLCLKKILSLSAASQSVWLPTETLNKCLQEINYFTFEGSIKDILLYENFLFRLNCAELKPPLCSYKKIDKVISAIENQFLPALESELQEYIKCEEHPYKAFLFEKSLRFCSVSQVESRFKELSFEFIGEQNIPSMSLPFFKFIVNGKRSSTLHNNFDRMLWTAMVCRRDDLVRFLLQKELNFDFAGFFRRLSQAHWASVRESGLPVIKFIIDNKLIDYDQLRALSTRLSVENNPYLTNTVNYLRTQIDRKTAITLLGIFKFRLSPIAKPSRDIAQVIAQQVVGRQTTALDAQRAELPEVSRDCHP